VMSVAAEPMVSVLVPSLNASDFIHTALTSVLDANVPLEVIVQDGGSADVTHKIVRSIADERVRLFVEQDQGQADALNRALALARGEFVLWLNADDVVIARGLEQAIGATKGADVVYGGWGLIDLDGRRIKTYRPGPLEHRRLLRRGTYIFSGSLLVRREVLRALGGFAPSLHCCMDFDLLVRIARSGAKAKRIDDEIGLLRIHPASKGQRAPWRFFREHWRVAWRERARAPELLPWILLAQTRMAVYLLTRPIWRSRIWLWIRPAKSL
jgi:glycosyltransferase involved in cell wall biosynthesis